MKVNRCSLAALASWPYLAYLLPRQRRPARLPLAQDLLGSV